MRQILSRLLVFCAFVAATATLVLVFAPAHSPVQAQDEMMMGPACDSTLATLLLVAEHNYDYISNMMTAMPDSTPHLDLGQYGPLIDEVVANMMAMQGDMTDEEMMAAEEMNTMTNDMMMMSDTDIINSYFTSMGMDMVDFSTLTTLAPGDVEGQDALCAQVRADVQQFLLVHTIADMEMSMMSDSQ
ncbi:MAG: hypothetical protein U0694_04640 [Anaerolineae bacterium]